MSDSNRIPYLEGRYFCHLSYITLLVAGKGVEPLTLAYETNELPVTTHPTIFAFEVRFELTTIRLTVGRTSVCASQTFYFLWTPERGRTSTSGVRTTSFYHWITGAFFVEDKGFEPLQLASVAQSTSVMLILPVYALSESNTGHPACNTGTLPTELKAHFFCSPWRNRTIIPKLKV